jgi:hypothetical protein
MILLNHIFFWVFYGFHASYSLDSATYRVKLSILFDITVAESEYGDV